MYSTSLSYIIAGPYIRKAWCMCVYIHLADQAFHQSIVVHNISTIHCVQTMHVYIQVNDIAFHPVHGTLATVGSDGRFSFWDKDARTKLKTSEQLDQPISCCAFNAQGQIFAYASSYDWSKVSFTVIKVRHCYSMFQNKIDHNTTLAPGVLAVGGHFVCL